MNQFFNKNILITGMTGSGKSLFLHQIIINSIKENGPETLKLVLIDPKRIEFSFYKNLPHMLSGIIYDLEEARDIFKQILDESDKRLENKNNLPKILIIIDELSDLMASDQYFFEEYVEKITKSSDNTGIYLIVSTSRPSPRDVYTKRILDCFKTKICFQIYSEVDSLLIIGNKKAKELSKPGSCLIKDETLQTIESFQSPYISYEEIEIIVEKIN